MLLLNTISTVFLVLAGLATADTPISTSPLVTLIAQCGEKNPLINEAIANFCNAQPIMAPSDYASVGMPAGGSHLYIDSHCSPAEYIPTEYCLQQFSQICATSGHPRGHGVAYWGTNGCQQWSIWGGRRIHPVY